jgi:hypothetical protein
MGPITAPVATALNTDLPQPTNLAFAGDQATCDKVRAGLGPGLGDIDICTMLPHIYAGIFYWNWHGNSAHPTPLGFRVYRVDGGRHDLLRQTHFAAPGIVEGLTAFFSGGLVSQACYAVTAVDQTAESAPTAPLCIPAWSAPVSAALAPRIGPVLPGPVGVSAAQAAAPQAVAPPRIPAPSQPIALKQPAAFPNPRDPRSSPCAVNGGPAGLRACESSLPRGGVALIWSYGPAHIDGFRVYAVPRGVSTALPGPPAAVQKIRLESGQIATLAVLEPRGDGFANECFTVTAFAGHDESDMSPPVCISP